MNEEKIQDFDVIHGSLNGRGVIQISCDNPEDVECLLRIINRAIYFIKEKRRLLAKARELERKEREKRGKEKLSDSFKSGEFL